MSDDVVGRSEEFDRKVSAAGSTTDIVGALVKGAARNKRVIKWLVISIILDVLLSLFLGGVTIFAYRNDRAVDRVARTSCAQSARNSAVINQFLNLQIANTKTSHQRTEAQKKVTVDSYQRLLIKIPDCR